MRVPPPFGLLDLTVPAGNRLLRLRVLRNRRATAPCDDVRDEALGFIRGALHR